MYIHVFIRNLCGGIEAEVPYFYKDFESRSFLIQILKLVGIRGKGRYENGWFYGTIDYSNKVFEEYKVTYSDNTTYLIRKADIDGID